jgi:hypothetical protein
MPWSPSPNPSSLATTHQPTPATTACFASFSFPCSERTPCAFLASHVVVAPGRPRGGQCTAGRGGLGPGREVTPSGADPQAPRRGCSGVRMLRSGRSSSGVAAPPTTTACFASFSYLRCTATHDAAWPGPRPPPRHPWRLRSNPQRLPQLASQASRSPAPSELHAPSSRAMSSTRLEGPAVASAPRSTVASALDGR